MVALYEFALYRERLNTQFHYTISNKTEKYFKMCKLYYYLVRMHLSSWKTVDVRKIIVQIFTQDLLWHVKFYYRVSSTNVLNKNLGNWKIFCHAQVRFRSKQNLNKNCLIYKFTIACLHCIFSNKWRVFTLIFVSPTKIIFLLILQMNSFFFLWEKKEKNEISILLPKWRNTGMLNEFETLNSILHCHIKKASIIILFIV